MDGIAEKRDDGEQRSPSSRSVFLPRISNALWTVDTIWVIYQDGRR